MNIVRFFRSRKPCARQREARICWPVTGMPQSQETQGQEAGERLRTDRGRERPAGGYALQRRDN